MSDTARGLYDKYQVERTDGSSAPMGKHEYCEYFVLDMRHDLLAVPALRAYADAAAAKGYIKLAADLRFHAGALALSEFPDRDRR